MSSCFHTDLPLQPIFALHFLAYPHFRSFSSIKHKVNWKRNWREAGDDQQVFEETEVVVPNRNIRSKRKTSSYQKMYLAVAEVYARPGTATSRTHSAQVSPTESWNSRSCNWEKSKCQFEREMLADYSRPWGMISTLTKKAKQCGNQLLNRGGPAGKSVLENCPILKGIGCERCRCKLLYALWVCKEKAARGQKWVRPGFGGAAAPGGVLRRTPRAVVLSEGPEDASTAGGKAGKPFLSERDHLCRAASAHPGGQLLFQTSRVSSVTTSCRRNRITPLCNTHCMVERTKTSNKSAHTMLHLVLHGLSWRSLPAVAPGAPKPLPDCMQM